jgi:hypothetical protein
MWDGSDWTQIQDTGPNRFGHKLTYDPVRDRVVLFAGAYLIKVTGEFSFANDTWEWDGNQWTRVADTGPSARYEYGLVYDNQRVLLFGGVGNDYLGDTWAWDGKHWTQIQDIGPAGRYDLGMTYDSARKRTVLFGGLSSNSFGDTWELFDPPHN